MVSLKKVFYIMVSCLILFACSDESSNSSQKDHVWKEQTDTIDKAKEVEGMMLESAAATRKAIDKYDE
jgi:outer membrane biogenesis lipoprotein LolB